MNSKPTTFSFEAIGTHWQIDFYQPILRKKLEELKSKILARIEEFDKNYSRFRPDSWISQIAKQEEMHQVPADFDPLMSLYHNLYQLTGGLVTPLIGQLLVDAGYDETYSLTIKKELSSPPAWDTVIDYHYPHLKLKAPTLFDFGAAGKGYLIDIVGALLEQEGITAYCTDAGGDIKHAGSSLRVGLENPNNLEQIIGIATIDKVSICASSGSRRKWEGFHHIINPLTRTPVQSITATWVTASTTVIADAIATCLFFVDPETLVKTYDFEYLILRADNTVKRSKKFPAELFTA